MELLNMKFGPNNVSIDGRDYDELVILAATFEGCQDFEPRDIIWAKLTGHAMRPAIIVDQSVIDCSERTNSGEEDNSNSGDDDTKVGKPALLRSVLQQKEKYSKVLQGLGKDDEDTVASVLSTLQDKILVEESLIFPGLRSVLFGVLFVLDLDDVPYRKKVFVGIQALISGNLVSVGHDNSDGGPVVAVLEMAFAGNKGINIDLASNGMSLFETLFSEELGLVVGTNKTNLDAVMEKLRGFNVTAEIIGKATDSPLLELKVDGITHLSEKTSFFRRLQSETASMMDEMKVITEAEQNYESHHMVFLSRLDYLENEMQLQNSVTLWELRKAPYSLWHRWRRKDSHNYAFRNFLNSWKFAYKSLGVTDKVLPNFKPATSTSICHEMLHEFSLLGIDLQNTDSFLVIRSSVYYGSLLRPPEQLSQAVTISCNCNEISRGDGRHKKIDAFCSEVQSLKDEAEQAVEQLQQVEKEMEEVVLKRRWLARYWELVVQHVICDDIATSRQEHWSALAIRLFKVVFSAALKRENSWQV